MHNGVKYFLAFSAGAAAGVAVAWRILKTKYEKIAQEEIQDVIKWFSDTEGNNPIDDDTCSEKPDKIVEEGPGVDVIEARNIIESAGYVANKKGGSESMSDIKPYVISPEEFGDQEDYETISLTYYADEVLADDMDELVEDVEQIVGLDFHTHFGEYEDDSVFIRNDELKADYEILLDARNYADLNQAKTE